MGNKKREFLIGYFKFMSKKNRNGDRDELMKECERTAELIPDDFAINDLTNSSSCVLCRNEVAPNAATGYAVVDFGHAEPKERNKELTGTSEGSVLPVVMACCDRCKTVHKMIEVIPTLVSAVLSLIALIVCSNQTVHDKLCALDIVFIPQTMRPFVTFALAVVLSIVIGVIIKKLMIEKLSVKTVLDVSDIPQIAELEKAGWFEINKPGCRSGVMTTAKRPEYACQSASDDEDDDDAEEVGEQVEIKRVETVIQSEEPVEQAEKSIETQDEDA